MACLSASGCIHAHHPGGAGMDGAWDRALRLFNMGKLLKSCRCSNKRREAACPPAWLHIRG
eukprot:362203-Chlamydomonas_euryale.AAC.6